MPPFLPSAPYVRSFSSSDGGHRVDGGCAVLVGRGDDADCPLAQQEDTDDFAWTDAQTAAFMAGEPVTLGWVSKSPGARASQGAYVYCWITLDSD